MTMALFNSSSPAYKTANSPNAVYAPVAPSSGLAGLFGSLLGGSTPTYKTLDGQAGQAPAAPSSGLMRIFIGSDPTYKTAQLAADADAVDNDNDDGACDAPIDTVVVL
jgi:hypothetical protein